MVVTKEQKLADPMADERVELKVEMMAAQLVGKRARLMVWLMAPTKAQKRVDQMVEKLVEMMVEQKGVPTAEMSVLNLVEKLAGLTELRLAELKADLKENLMAGQMVAKKVATTARKRVDLLGMKWAA